MTKVGNTWIPDGDRYFAEVFHKSDVFEMSNLLTGLRYVKRWDAAIDGGAHVGSWSRALAARFNTVFAFEPVTPNYECLLMNAADSGLDNVEARRMALGNRYGTVRFAGGNNSGCWHVSDGKEGHSSPMMPLDEMRYLNDHDIGYLKLDVEGYEWFALDGARNLLRRCRPVVQIEEKALPHSYDCTHTARELLEEIGYKEVDRSGRDVVFAWD